MQLVLSFKTILAFLALSFVCHEIHELSHTTIAYLQCNCWGGRDFNAWTICTSCGQDVKTVWATIAGPLFTYTMVWTAWWLMSPLRSIRQQSFGFALLWANLPFARLFTVLMRGGDEGVITRTITGQQILPIDLWFMEIITVLLLLLPAILRAWNLLLIKKRILVFISFLLIPMLIQFITMHKLGNDLLEKGLLTQYDLTFSPALVLSWNIFWLVILLVCFKYNTRLLNWDENLAFSPVVEKATQVEY